LADPRRGAPSSGALAVSESGHFSAFNRGKEYVLQAIRAGASGYLLKDAAVAELELALQAAVRGEAYLSPRISKQSSRTISSVWETRVPP
jgi:DNA-binding NarL/FixJ family response regulator